MLARTLLLGFFSLPLSAQTAQPVPPAGPVPAANYGKLPLSFEANQGQTDPQVRFLARSGGYSLFLTDQAAVLSLRRPEGPGVTERAKRFGKTSAKRAVETDVLRMEIAGGSPAARVEGAAPMPGTANYLLGNDAAKWRRDVPTFAQVRYTGVYPGVDLVYYGNQGQLEYDFIVQPHANAKPIRLHFAGAEKLALTTAGDLTIAAGKTEIAFHKPVVYQEVAGHRQIVEGAFTLLAGNDVAFTLGRYDREQPLTIDPSLSYAAYIGNAVAADTQNLAVDASGSAYVVGYTGDPYFPATAGAFQTVNHNSLDIFITKLNPAGTAVVYTTFLGGTGGTSGTREQAQSIAVDSAGSLYITGQTFSTDFPMAGTPFQNVNKGAAAGLSNCFVSKLNPAGSSLVYSTYLGGHGGKIVGAGTVFYDSDGPEGDACSSIQVDGSGDAYVAGGTASVDFPTTTGAYQTTISPDIGGAGFVAKLNPAGSALIFSTFTNYALPISIAIDSSGNSYAGGEAITGFKTTTGAFQTKNPNDITKGYAGFIAKLNPAGSALSYGTFLGGLGVFNGTDATGNYITNLAVDAAGEVYAGGIVDAANFPTSRGAFQSTNKAVGVVRNLPPYNMTVTKLNAAGSAQMFSTFLGGSIYTPGPSGLAIDAGGNVYVAGTSMDIDYPVTSDAFQPQNNSAGHPFIPNSTPAYPATLNSVLTELNSSGYPVYSTYFGGSGYGYYTTPATGSPFISLYVGDNGAGLAVDPTGNIYLAGQGSSLDLPVSPGAYKYASPSQQSVFLAKFSPAASALTRTSLSLTSTANPQNAGSPVTFNATILPASGTRVPSGSVTFAFDDGSTAPVTVPLDATGKAALTLSTLPVDNETLVASYGGDSFFTFSSRALSQRIVSVATTVTTLSGAKQTAGVGTPFASPVVVQVVNVNGLPVANAIVTFSGPGLSFSPIAATTNTYGQASTAATPTLAGVLRIKASVAGSPFVIIPESATTIPSAKLPAFASMALLTTGSSANGQSLLAVAGDFNRDGKLDLATTNNSDSALGLMLGNGNGTFLAPTTTPVGKNTLGVATGDFDGDGLPDLAAVNGDDSTISVVLGKNGLKSPTLYSVGVQPYAIATADLNLDGFLDLVITNTKSKTLTVYNGKGDGTFQLSGTYNTGNLPFGLAIADVNNDGYPDLLVTYTGDVTVGTFMNDKSGGFGSTYGGFTSTQPFSVAVGDFDGDGIPDLAIANIGAANITIHKGDGTGRFNITRTYFVGVDPAGVVAVDLNADGILDLAVANLGSGTVSILLGKGDGSFLNQVPVQAGTQPFQIVPGDFNGDGRPDLAVTSFFSNTLGLLLQTAPATGAGHIVTGPKQPVSVKPTHAL